MGEGTINSFLGWRMRKLTDHKFQVIGFFSCFIMNEGSVHIFKVTPYSTKWNKQVGQIPSLCL